MRRTLGLEQIALIAIARIGAPASAEMVIEQLARFEYETSFPSLWSTLVRLEEKKLLKHSLAPSRNGKKPRRMFALTAGGKREVDASVRLARLVSG